MSQSIAFSFVTRCVHSLHGLHSHEPPQCVLTEFLEQTRMCVLLNQRQRRDAVLCQRICLLLLFGCGDPQQTGNSGGLIQLRFGITPLSGTLLIEIAVSGLSPEPSTARTR